MAVPVNRVLECRVLGYGLLRCASHVCVSNRLGIAESFQRSLASLGVQLCLRWASPDGDGGFVAVLPLINGPAHAETQAADGEEEYGGNEPPFRHVPDHNRKNEKLQC